MKKIYTIFALLFMLIAINANAQEVYFKSTKVQVGAEGKIELCLETPNPIGTVNVEFTLPEGVTVQSIQSDGAAITFNPAINNLLLGKGAPFYSTGVVATITVNVDADANLGDYPMIIKMAKIVEPNLTTYDFDNVESTMTIQRTAVIEDQDPNYALEVIPFAVDKGATSASIPVNMVNKDEVAYISFDVEFPSGITPTKSGRAFTKPTVNGDRLTNGGEITALSAKAPTLVPGTTTTYHYELNNEEIDTYDADGSGLAMTLPVTLAVEEGVYTVKLTNINIQSTTDYESFTDHTGEYYFSTFVGNPVADAILYGHYTEEGKKAAATMQGGTADITAANVDGELSLNDVLVLSKEATSYNRANGGIATICLPYELTSSETTKYYTLKEISAKTMTFEEVETVPANTPALVQGTIATCAEGYIMPGTAGTVAVAGTTMTGTYEMYELAASKGYYIAGGKFYSDGATVKPFRAYFDGVVTGVKSFSVQIETATGIIDVTDQLSNEDIYSLQGIKMNKTQKGVNIVGNKKVYVK